MLNILKSIWKYSTRRERLLLFVVMLFMFFSANLELLGIGLLLPVVALLTNPELIHQNYYLDLIYRILNPSSTRSFLLLLCLSIVLVFLVKNAFLAFMLWFQNRIIYAKTNQMADALFRTYVFAPYSIYLKRNTAELLSRLGVIRGDYCQVMLCLMMQMTELLNVVMIFGMFFFFVPVVTLILLVISLVVSLLIYFPLRKVNSRLGQKYFQEGNLLNRNDLQTFNGIKEIKILGSEEVFALRNRSIMERMSSFRIRMSLSSQAPRFLLEVSMISGAVLLLVLYLLSGTANTSIILKLSLIGAGIVRLMPALSRIQYHFTLMRQFQFSLDSVYQDLNSIPRESTGENHPPVTFEHELKLDKIGFAYENTVTDIFKDFSLTIPVNSSVAFIGRTGCGKTTLVDLIAGLLQPDRGEILVDGRNIRENLSSWRSLIGYVPQFIYIMDDTILANVTLGSNPDQIDLERVHEALRMAQLDEFVSSLPDGLNTMVGDRGARLSGGQRQRIGIARALYHRPRVLILDEATSALDNETEKAFVDAIEVLRGKLTLLIIAHRLTTTRNCSMIIDVEAEKRKI